jgi:hypothetical protein
LINEATCSDAGSPSACRCDIRLSENSGVNVPCGIVLCDTSIGLGRTCFADGGQAQVSCP